MEGVEYNELYLVSYQEVKTEQLINNVGYEVVKV
jgi:hypothetical protein